MPRGADGLGRAPALTRKGQPWPRTNPAQINGTALAVGAGCYFIWGLVPLAFQIMGRIGIGAWEILAHRTLWAVPTALLFVLLARRVPQLAAVLRSPRTMALADPVGRHHRPQLGGLHLAVNNGHVLETSLGYFINPLMTMAAGAMMFRERMDNIAKTAIALALDWAWSSRPPRWATCRSSR